MVELLRIQVRVIGDVSRTRCPDRLTLIDKPLLLRCSRNLSRCVQVCEIADISRPSCLSKASLAVEPWLIDRWHEVVCVCTTILELPGNLFFERFSLVTKIVTNLIVFGVFALSLVDDSLALSLLFKHLVSLSTHCLLQIVPRTSSGAVIPRLFRKRLIDHLSSPAFGHEDPNTITPDMQWIVSAHLFQSHTNRNIHLADALESLPDLFRSPILYPNIVLQSRGGIAIFEYGQEVATRVHTRLNFICVIAEFVLSQS